MKSSTKYSRLLVGVYPHRFADIILNSDYALKQEIE